MPANTKRFMSLPGFAGVLLLLACAGSTGIALAEDKGPCSVQGSCAMTREQPLGLAWDGTHLWVGYGPSGQIQRIDPADCTVVGSIDAPDFYVTGLAWDGTALWVSVESSGFIYRLDPATGDILSQIPSPSPTGQHGAAGLAWDGVHLWHVDYRLRALYRLDPSDGTILDSTYLGFYMGGIGFRSSDGHLVISDFGEIRIFTVDPALPDLIQSTCDAPGTKPWGVALAGDEVWSLDNEDDLLSDLGLLTDVANESWTWSRVRAAYR